MRFFFYGTLIAGSRNAVASDIHTKLQLVGPGTVRGRLYALRDPEGWYPALLAGTGRVHGMVYVTLPDFRASDLARLDEYEDFEPAAPRSSLYQRKVMTVSESNRSTLLAQAYRFNRPLPSGARPIPGGDFRGWLAARGLEAFGGQHGN